MSGTGAQFADVVASGPLLLGILAAAAAGFVSFASPCVVPLVPGYMSYLAGVVGWATVPLAGCRCGVDVHRGFHRGICAGNGHRVWCH